MNLQIIVGTPHPGICAQSSRPSPLWQELSENRLHEMHLALAMQKEQIIFVLGWFRIVVVVGLGLKPTTS